MLDVEILGDDLCLSSVMLCFMDKDSIGNELLHSCDPCGVALSVPRWMRSKLVLSELLE